MDAPRYRIGNDLSVFWAIHNRDNSPFNMEGMDVRLFVTNERGRKEVDVVLATLPDGTINNVIRWDFKGEDQRVLGLHTLTVEILESATHREIIRDYCQAFEMVGRSESETEEGDANISIGGDLILSSKLDIYRFEATNVDLSGIKESMHDISESIKDINEESVEIKVAINGIQTQVNDIGTELTTKASVGTVVEIGEQITEVQTNVAEQTIRVNSLEAEIETKASAESVTNIADELKITNETLAQQVVKVTDLTAEVATKASSEMVTEIANDLKITSNTLAEQTLRVDALSAEVSTKASAESVADITEDLQLVEKSVAEQTLRVDAVSAEIATKASSERVLALEGDVAVVERAVAEQTVKVEGLEASIENKVSREEFNEKTGELDQSYTSLKQTADSLTLEVGEQGEALIKVEADVNGLSVRVDDIGDAQANYDETLSELTEILTPEEMSTQIGKGVVLSTVIATRDEEGNITAGMNASSVHSDPVHGRVVIAGGVKNKTDWTKATTIIYEHGHMVVNSGEFGENVKIGDAMFRAVLEGDFDVFSYPENGTLVPLFQVNKDANGKIVSVSTPYDFIANKNLIVHGDTSSGGEGGGSSVGIQGIIVNGVTYRDTNGDGLIDLGEIGGGTITEITSEMITEALGYVPYNASNPNGYITASALGGYATQLWVEGKGYAVASSLGSLAYKNGLTASDIPDLSGIYLPTSGGFMNNMASIKWYANVHSWDDAPDGLIGVSMVSDALGYHGGLSYKGYYGLQIRAYGGDADDISVRGYNHSAWGTWRTLYHTGNFNPADYLPKIGGTITIDNPKGITIKRNTSSAGALLWFANNAGYLGAICVSENKTLLFDNDTTAYDILHSGNVGEYALNIDGSNARSTKLTSSENLDDYQYGFYSYTNGNNPTNSFGDNTAVFAFTSNRGNDTWQIAFDGNGINNTAGPRFGIRGNYANQGWTSWYRIATTDSNVASATKLATARTIWGQSFDGTGNISGNLVLDNNSGILSYDSTGATRYLLHLSNNNILYIGNTSAQAGYSTYINGNDIYFRYGTSRTTGLILNSSGYVFIGTTTEKESGPLLQVNGGGYFGADTYLANWAYLRSYKTDGSKVSVIGINNNNLLLINGANSAVNTAILGGEVGIGTTDPQYKLDVNGYARANAIVSNVVIDINRNPSNGAVLNSNLMGLEIEACASRVQFKAYTTSGTSLTGITINSNDYIGIGTTDPSFKLHVNGTAKINDIVRLGADLYVSQDSTAYGLQLWGDADGGYLGVHAKGSFKSTNMRFGYDGSATVYGNLVVQGDISA